MKIAILGFGREGQSLLKFLQKRGLKRNKTRIGAKNEIWILDKNPKSVSGIKGQVAGVRTGKNYLKRLKDFDIIFRSPGIPYLLPEIQKAEKAGTEISSQTKLFFDEIEKESRVVIGVTGTKGKGTTSTLLYQILKAAGKDVHLAGNIGVPALNVLPKLKKNSFVILELSSFQLQDLNRSPRIAVALTMFPDHLDAHKNLKEYFDAKANIARCQKPADKIFFFGDDKLSRWAAEKSRGRKIAVSQENFKLFSPENLLIKGEHNFKNAVMAATVAQSLGVPDTTILNTVKKFRGLEHRLEFIRTIKLPVKKHSHILKNIRISFYNDSASTSPQTTAAAIKAFPEEKILIGGGYDKNLDYRPLANALASSNTKLVILFGQNKKKIEKTITYQVSSIKYQKYKVTLVKDLRTAVRTAYKYAKKPIHQFTNSPIAVIFSPGAASFDMFENYADRGRQFKNLVKKL